MACVLWDDYLKKTQPCHASVMTDDNEAYGQVILYKEGYGYDSQVTFDNYNFYVATETDSKIFKEKLIALLDE